MSDRTLGCKSQLPSDLQESKRWMKSSGFGIILGSLDGLITPDGLYHLTREQTQRMEHLVNAPE